MNIALENELIKINTEIAHILQLSKNAIRGEFILANDKSNILKENIDKYNALIRLREIINNNFSDLKNPYEFLNLCEVAGLTITEEEYQNMLNQNHLQDKDLEEEKSKVNELIKKIQEASKNETRGVFMLAADSRNILKSEVERYNALIRMKELLDNNFLDLKYKYEYEDLANIAGLNEINKKILNPQIVFDNEYALVTARIKKLQNTSGINYEENIEYLSLLKMLDYLKNNFSNMKHIFDYQHLRKKTNLGELDDDLYFMLINPKLPKVVNEKKNQELTTIVSNKILSTKVLPEEIETLDVLPPEDKKVETKKEEKEEEIKQDSEVKELAETTGSDSLIYAKGEEEAEEKEESPKETELEQKKVQEPEKTLQPQNTDITFGQKIKVVGKKSLSWLNEHKKQILIALAIAGIIATVILAFNALMPAITSAIKAAEISSISTSMISNSALWHGAEVATQSALHASNVTLASALENLIGSTALYNSATGVWTIGGMELTSFAVSASTAAESALATAAATTNTLLGIGSASSVLGVAGCLLPKVKSEQYKKYNKEIKEIKNADVFDQVKFEALVSTINADKTLKNNEKTRLMNNLKKIYDKNKDLNKGVTR